MSKDRFDPSDQGNVPQGGSFWGRILRSVPAYRPRAKHQAASEPSEFSYSPEQAASYRNRRVSPVRHALAMLAAAVVVHYAALRIIEALRPAPVPPPAPAVQPLVRAEPAPGPPEAGLPKPVARQLDLHEMANRIRNRKLREIETARVKIRRLQSEQSALERKVQQKELELIGTLRSRSGVPTAGLSLDDLYAELSTIEPQIVYEREAILRLQKDLKLRDEVLVLWEQRQREQQDPDSSAERTGL